MMMVCVRSIKVSSAPTCTQLTKSAVGLNSDASDNAAAAAAAADSKDINSSQSTDNTDADAAQCRSAQSLSV